MTESYTKRYFPNLDATRFIAFLAVFVEHMLLTNSAEIKSSGSFTFFENHLHLASLGVGFFIVLSGFLITWIILEEFKFTDKFNLSFFWIRRCLRTWPLYFLLVAIAYLLVFIGKNFVASYIHNMPPFIWLGTFTLNFYIINYGQAFLFFIVFFWSISVEEQLYILWGLFLKYLKKYFIAFCVLMIAASVAFRIHFVGQSDHMYFSTINWLPHFALGGLVAYMGIKECTWYQPLKKLPRSVIMLIYLLFILNIIFYNRIYFSPFMTILQRPIDALFFAFFIFELNFCDNRFINPGKSKILSYLGKISYGLFCYHGLVILLFTKLVEPFGWLSNSTFVFFINPLLIFALTVLISIISFKYFETPLVALRTRFKRA